MNSINTTDYFKTHSGLVFRQAAKFGIEQLSPEEVAQLDLSKINILTIPNNILDGEITVDAINQLLKHGICSDNGAGLTADQDWLMGKYSPGEIAKSVLDRTDLVTGPGDIGHLGPVGPGGCPEGAKGPGPCPKGARGMPGTPGMQPYFVFDGADGVGKTTWLKQFKLFLEAKGHDVILVREPGGTKPGNVLRELIFSEPLGDDVNLQLFIADRLLTQQMIIKPALEKGIIVLSDRSMLSTMVYQGFPTGRQNEVVKRHMDIPSFLFPSHGFVCKLDYETCVERLSKRAGNEPNNHFDEEAESSQRFRHECYNNARSWAPFYVSYLDFSQDANVINEEVYRVFQEDFLIYPPTQG